MLYYETIHPDTLELLKKIQSLELFAETRLVGGTALALQIGHRKSVDLDFFGHMDASLEEIAGQNRFLKCRGLELESGLLRETEHKVHVLHCLS